MAVRRGTVSKSPSPEDRSPLHADWSVSARLLRVIAHPIRLAVLQALTERSHCMKDLNAIIRVPQAQLSQHMAALRKADLVDSHIKGPLRLYYVLRPKMIRGLIRVILAYEAPHRRTRTAVLREIQRAEQREARGTTAQTRNNHAGTRRADFAMRNANPP